jgi:hypothetical protein
MSAYTALLDANVLYPAPMRDIFLQLAVTDLFRAKATADIHREWIEAQRGFFILCAFWAGAGWNFKRDCSHWVFSDSCGILGGRAGRRVA